MMLAQYKTEPNEEYWYKNFNEISIEQGLKEARNNPLFKIILSHLKPSMKVIEVGAGYGRFIKILQESGIKNVSGIEINEKLIDMGKKIKIKIEKADIRNLPYKNNSMDAYIDMGVLEHFSIEDQKSIIKEANRVLKKEGLAFINVPVINNIRKIIYPLMYIKNKIKKIRGAPFYQYIYTKNEICSLIENYNFKVARTKIIGPRILVISKKII
jgi:ubiquinone/menaquinone biosynthesis C-methylase UbiE